MNKKLTVIKRNNYSKQKNKKKKLIKNNFKTYKMIY